ncbi:MAG: 2-phosphosulfolactate phosphatase [Gemmatimonadota bacterium]
MRVDVLWTPGEAERVVWKGTTAVVIDVLRASTSILTALEAGARTAIPAESTEDALRMADSLGRGNVLLCGEREGRRIEGYDLGNSPLEYGADAVRGATLICSTTNGTVAMRRAGEAEAVLIGCFRNLAAVADAVRRAGRPTIVACAGRLGRVSLEDALCAGLLVQALTNGESVCELTDGARSAAALGPALGAPDEAFLSRTAAGAALTDIGLGADLAFCAELDASETVPVLVNGGLVADARAREDVT